MRRLTKGAREHQACEEYRKRHGQGGPGDPRATAYHATAPELPLKRVKIGQGFEALQGFGQGDLSDWGYL